MNIARLRKNFDLQHGQSDCGVACLSSIIKFHGGHKTLDEIRRLSGTGKSGTSLLGLYQAAGKLGFSVSGLEAEGIKNLAELDQPAILHVLLDSKLEHYVVYYGREGDELIIGDPAKGVEKWTVEKLESVWKSKSLLRLEPNESFIRSHKEFNRYHKLIEWIKEDTNILLSSLFIGILIAIFSLATAVFSQKLIDVILPSKDVTKLAIGLFLFGFVLLARNALTFIRTKFLITQSRDFNIRMISSFIQSLLSLPKSFFDSKKTGEMIARMNDTKRIQSTLSGLVGNLLIECLIIIISLVAVFGYSWQIGLMVVGFAPFYLLIIWKLNQPIISAQKNVMSSYAINESNYIDVITGISAVKSCNSRGLFGRGASALYAYFQDRVFQLGTIQIRFAVLIELVGVILMVSVIAVGSYFVIQESLMLGSMMAVLSLAGTIGPSLARIAVFNIQMQEAKVAFIRMTEFTELDGEELNGDPVVSVDNIEFQKVSFSYPGSLHLLKEVNLTVEKGKITSLMGESGSGKSTLIQLVQRFYDPTGGAIKIGVNNLSEVRLESIRACVSVVAQDIKIFNNFLLFNIAMNEDVETLSKVEPWCKKWGFDKFFAEFPQGYATLLGEEGANISGGQRQLVGLARALFRNPQMLLVDEGTSALDRETERFVIATLNRIKNHCGVLMVTHRLHTALEADEIYLMENGTVRHLGSPQEALSAKNLISESYQELAKVGAV